MEKFEQLLEIEKGIIKIWEKLNQVNEKENLYLLLEDFLDKEKHFLNSLSKKELQEMMFSFNENYGYDTESNLWLEILEHKNDPKPLLRIFSLFYHYNLFYKFQSFTDLTKEEANQWIGIPYIEKIKSNYRSMQDWNNQVYEQLCNQNKEYQEFQFVLIREFSDLFQFTKEQNNVILDEECIGEITTNLSEILYKIAQEEEKEDLLCLLSVYLELASSLTDTNIKFYVMTELNLFYKKLSEEEKNTTWWQEIKKQCDQYQFDFLNYNYVIEQENVNDDDMLFFNNSNIEKLNEQTIKLKQYSQNVLEAYQKIFLKKIAQEQISENEIDLFFYWLIEEQEYLKSIEDTFELYQYIDLFYPQKGINIPEEVEPLINAFIQFSLEGFTEKENLIVNRILDLLIKTQNKIEEQEETYGFIQLMDEDSLLDDMLDQVFFLSQLNMLYLSHQLTEEEYLLELEQLDNPGNEEYEYESGMFKNYIYFLNQKLEESKLSEEDNKKLQILCYALIFLDNEMLTLTTKNDFQIPVCYTTFSKEKMIYQKWKKLNLAILSEYQKMKSNDLITNLSIEAYIEALKSTLDEQTKKRLEDSSELKLKKRKKNRRRK